MANNGSFRVADLCDAAASGDVSRIKQILGEQPDLVNVHMAENNEHRAIHYAVMNRNIDAVRVLMEAGADHNSGIYPPPRCHRRVYHGPGTRPGRHRPRDQGRRRKT